MFTINVKSNIDKVLRDVQRKTEAAVKQAAARAITDTARDVRRAVMDQMPKSFDRPIGFTLRGIGYTQANATNLTARVFVRDAQAAYLAKQIEGGLETPKRRAFLKPLGVPLNAYGNLPRNKIKQLLARKDTFSGTVRGIGGIWQRQGKTLKLMVAYQHPRVVKPRLDFYGIAKRTVERKLVANLNSRLSAALKG